MVRCRVEATRSPESPLWTFYLVNDGPDPIERAELVAVRYEWGDEYRGGEDPGVSVADLVPGASAEIWQDDGSSEMRIDLWVGITQGGQVSWRLFEFPKLYRQQGTKLVSDGIPVKGPPGPI